MTDESTDSDFGAGIHNALRLLREMRETQGTPPEGFASSFYPGLRTPIVTLESIRAVLDSLPKVKPVKSPVLISSDLFDSLPKTDAEGGPRERSSLFGIPVELFVVTPDIRSQIDGIQAFRATQGKPKATKFGILNHPGTSPVVVPMGD